MSGSRIDGESTCIKCGGIIISLNPKLKMCNACEKACTESALFQIAHRKAEKRRWKLKVGALKGMRAPKSR
jgi:ferredoxin